MQITYNHGEIDALVADVKGIIGKIQAGLEELQHDVNPLIQQQRVRKRLRTRSTRRLGISLLRI